MQNAISNWQLYRKFGNDLDKNDFDFNIKFEVPKQEELLSDFFSVAAKPNIITLPDKVASTMVANGDTLANFLSLDEGSLQARLADEGMALVPSSILNMGILNTPELNLTVMGGYLSWQDMTDDARNMLHQFNKECRLSIFDGRDQEMLLPLDIFESLWEMDKKLLVFSGHGGVQLDPTNQMIFANLLGKRVPYLKKRNVRTVRVNVKVLNKGIYMNFL